MTILHTGDLTDLIAKPAPEREQLQLQGSENIGTVTADHSVEKRDRTKTEQKSGSILKTAQAADLPVNSSPFRFGSIPDVSLLKLGKETAGHSCDLSIRNIRRTRRFLDLISADGTLRLTPVHDSVIRVQFLGQEFSAPAAGYWKYVPEEAPAWTARAGKSLAELTTAELKVQIDKRSGAIRFLDKNGRKLLTESRLLPRLIEPGDPVRTWNYFDWLREEKLYVKGILAEDRELIKSKARYISFGGKNYADASHCLRVRIRTGIAADETVMCCNVPVYGTYLYTEGTGQIDYYFIYGENYEGILRLYKELQ